MAYISKEQSAKVRATLKTLFPTKDGWKFSVTIRHHSVLDLDILEAPMQLLTEEEQVKGYASLNSLHTIEKRKYAELLTKIYNICNEGNWDKSDSMTDYFNVGFYFYMSIGRYDKHFVCSRQNKNEIGSQAPEIVMQSCPQ